MHPLVHFSQYAPLLVELVVDAAALIGVAFIFRGLVKLKIYGEMRTMMAPHARINQILLLLFAGSLLVYFPRAARPIVTDALFGTSVIKELPYHATQSVNDDIKVAAKHIMYLIGHIALVRGIIQLGSYHEGGRNSLSKSIIHVISGACAINIEKTLVLLNSLVSVD